ncbi:MAG: hypothetical protein UV73_C0008G0060 [Candidatus Gottesmanbacteria bacterium GW2011_GWA2_43_14]|uniref:Uncharacterized protein n=1 Tax=Candidatus Gottesmanbacteria bacterium GW2011_GWA2_43_14 TaxID=1618443 RepID=A0A0G1DI78_9BACT|nr:MAG: hypothetical protein UV73_C0008G0060 [Candidatus Gottesmanbacteria bacterium GW2011_GWA2_43_14]
MGKEEKTGQEQKNLLSFQLYTPLRSDRLAVFIRDPQRPSIYHYREVTITSRRTFPLPFIRKEKEIWDTLIFEADIPIPVDAQDLQKHLKTVILHEANGNSGGDPAVVAVAKYHGGNHIELDELVRQTAMEFKQRIIEARQQL